MQLYVIKHLYPAKNTRKPELQPSEKTLCMQKLEIDVVYW